MLILNTLLLLHSAFMLSMEKMPLKGEVSGHALNSHGNYIINKNLYKRKYVHEYWLTAGSSMPRKKCGLVN